MHSNSYINFLLREIKTSKLFFISLFISLSFSVRAQVIYLHPDNKTSYDFISELAAFQYVDYNSLITPLSRKDIALFLQDTINALNSRQKAERLFYLKDFNKELLKDAKLFDKRLDLLYRVNENMQLTLNPIFGASYRTTPNALYRYFGAEFNAYLGKGWGVYASFREYYEQKQISSPYFLNQQRGGQIRGSTFKDGKVGAIDFTEMRGGMTYAWKWGNIALVQDHFQWGNNYNGSNIFSGKIPAMPQLKLNIRPFKWLEFNSTHVWLQSNVEDSTKSYVTENGTRRVVLREKYLTANFFSVRPFKNFWFSFGNSTVYGDIGIHPSYLLPFFFWRPIDHLLSGKGDNAAGQNGQLFFDISSRNIKGLHLYSNLFIDELAYSSAFDKDPAKRRNQISFKAGARYYNLLNKNAALTIEYTRSNPFAYRHYIPVTNFTSSDYTLGHYLGDNSQELYISFGYKPFRGFLAKIYYLNASKGEEVSFKKGAAGLTGIPFQSSIEFSQKELGVQLSYEWKNDVHVYFHAAQSNIIDKTNLYLPQETVGNKIRINTGFNIGF